MGYITPKPRQCECVHNNALTCIAEQNGTNRFNASIVFAGRSTQRAGRCQCQCHRDADGKPVTERAWLDARKQKEAEASVASGQRTFPKISAAPGIARPDGKRGPKARRQ